MLSFDGNTAPYLQYAHARICSIFRRAGVDRAERAGDRADARRRRRSGRSPSHLLGYGTAVAESVERYAPHRLCTYLYELASDFTAFYEHCPVLRADDRHPRDSRLALERPDGAGAGPRPRPARHRGARADVAVPAGSRRERPHRERVGTLVVDGCGRAAAIGHQRRRRRVRASRHMRASPATRRISSWRSRTYAAMCSGLVSWNMVHAFLVCWVVGGGCGWRWCGRCDHGVRIDAVVRGATARSGGASWTVGARSHVLAQA